MTTETEIAGRLKPGKRYDSESAIRKRRRQLFDRLARWVVAAGGFTIIASILAIMVFIAVEIAPLFRSAQVTQISRFGQDKLSQEPAEIVALGVEENQDVGYVVAATGEVTFFNLEGASPREVVQIAGLQGESITTSWHSVRGQRLVLGTGAGNAVVVRVSMPSTYFEGVRTYRPAVIPELRLTIDDRGQPISKLAFSGSADERMAIAAITRDDRVIVYLRRTEESLFGDALVDSLVATLEPIWSGRPTAIAIDGSANNIYLGTDDGKIYHWRASFENGPEFVTVARNSNNAEGITALTFLIGGRTLVSGDAGGGVAAWFLVRDNTATTGWRLTHIRDLKSHPAAVSTLSPSARGKGFISADAVGNLYLQHSTSERFLTEFHSAQNAIAKVSFTPKANGALALDADGFLAHFAVDNPHPEAGLNAFFGKVWYEGYDKPDYVWQSTGGTDEFEPKLSLVPLIFGSFKGTLYALILAIPLAIFGALFTSQFMHPALRNKIKPTVEIMAALPSVVLGFLGGLWLAPRIEQVVPALLTMAVVLPLLVLAAALTWHGVPKRLKNRLKPGVESLLLAPIVAVGIWLCLEMNGVVEGVLFNGDFKIWLYEAVGLRFDQRNALVVGIAMGFAVIPIIYTISEDALSNVPRNLISGSLALGATRWQTALRVVLPTAAAGIFSAIMIGLGRAVGETMIVLMATGNTPIMDWSIFNGFRTLSANIAVEIPEAPEGGTLYRVLFLAAMLLFVVTFIVNTGAEIVRQRLRTRYQKL